MRKALYPVALFSALFIFHPSKVIPADFTVSPVRLFLGAGQKASIIKVKNNSDEKLTLQLTVNSWEQDIDGESRYLPTEEIIFFPKIFAVEKDQERLIRVGAMVPPGEREKTYRIFLEEIPEPRQAPLEGTTLRTLTRLGVPIFIAPIKTEPLGDIEKVGLKQGELFLSVRNTGNVHFTIRAVKVEGIDASGATVFQRELAGWYLLEGRSKTFSLEVQKESCLSINALKIEVQTDRFSIGERLDVQPEMCP